MQDGERAWNEGRAAVNDRDSWRKCIGGGALTGGGTGGGSWGASSLCQGQIVLPYEALAKEPSKSRLGHCDLDSPQPINCQCEMPHYNYLFMIIFLSPVLLF